MFYFDIYSHIISSESRYIMNVIFMLDIKILNSASIKLGPGEKYEVSCATFGVMVGNKC